MKCRRCDWRDDPKVREYRDPTLWPDDYAVNAAAMEAAVAAYRLWLASEIDTRIAGGVDVYQSAMDSLRWVLRMIEQDVGRKR